MAETLLDALTDIRQRLNSKAYKNEEHVRFSLVGRVLLALGWDIWNPAEVNTEEKPHEGENHTKVDISLRIWGEQEAAVYLECKRVGKLRPELTKVEEQMLNYNKRNAAGLIVLTDGHYWHFYYAPGKGAFHDRLFAEYDLVNDDLTGVAAMLEALLGRSAVASGAAEENAKAQWQMRRRHQKMNELKAEAQTRVHHTRSLVQELTALMNERGFPATTEAEVTAFLDGESPAVPLTTVKAVKNTEVTEAQKKKITALKAKSLPPTAAEPAASGVAPRFTFGLKGTHATGVLLPDKKLRVLAGSTAAGSVTNSFNKKHERDALLADGTLVPQGEMLVFTRDHIFKTARAAADIIYASPVNALDAWRHEATGESLGNFLAANQSKA